MKVSTPVKDTIHIFFQFSALLAEKINEDIKHSSPNYRLIFIFLSNSIFGLFVSAILSLFISLLLFPFTMTLTNNFRAIFLVFTIMTGIMLITNLTSNQLNLPMLFLRIIFFLKFKVKSLIFFILVRIYLPVAAILISTYFLYRIIVNSLYRYGIENENISMYVVILSAALVVAGYYAFPVEKHERDLNELIISPILIIINIAISYLISKTNILQNLKSGNTDIAAKLLIIFAIATFLQFVTYFKKLFEKIHDLPQYSRRTYFYAYLARKRISFLVSQLKLISIRIIQLKNDIKSIKKDKYFFLHLITCIAIGLGSSFLLALLSKIKLPPLRLNKTTETYLPYIIVLGLAIFLIYKSCYLLVVCFNRKVSSSKKDKLELFGIAIVMLGLSTTMILSVFSIQLKIFIYLSTIVVLSGSFIMIISSFIKWLFMKRQAKKES